MLRVATLRIKARVGSIGIAASVPTFALLLALFFTQDAQAQTTFSNSSPITIPDFSAATPYPSTIAVSGFTGSTTKITVQITNLSHGHSDDVALLLVGPGGQNVMLMSGGGIGAVSGITLVFDDAAAAPVPDAGSLVSGTYRPANYFPSENLPAPAPAGPYGTVLSVFNNTSPNGDWKLYVSDQVALDSGKIAGGWSLTITATTPACSSSAAAGALTVTNNGAGGLTVTVTARSGTIGLLSFHGSPSAGMPSPNVLVDIGGQTGRSGEFTFAPSGSSQQFTIRRAVPSGAATLRFDVTDACGTWSTFAGGGPQAW